MQYRTLGRTGLEVSVIGFGTGGPSMFGQEAGLTPEQQKALVHRCLELGINLFDTAQKYGESERMLRRALEGVPRDSYILSTKWAHATTRSPGGVGGKDGPIHKDPQALVKGVEESLRRLGTDHIEIMHLHGLRIEQYDEVVERFGPVVARLKEQGKFRFIALSERYIADPRHEAVVMGLENDPDLWDVVMLKYGILNQWADRKALPLALEHGTGVMNMAAVRIKLPDPVKLKTLIADWKDRGLIGRRSVPDTDPLGWLVRDGVTSVIDAAYRFGLDHPAVSTLLTGTANIDHLEQNVRAANAPPLPESDKQRLRCLCGAIAEYA